jgi:hypothetical protein
MMLASAELSGSLAFGDAALSYRHNGTAAEPPRFSAVGSSGVLGRFPHFLW